MDKNIKKIVGILNSIDEIILYLIENKIEGNEYLIVDAENAINLCNEYLISTEAYSESEVVQLREYHSELIKKLKEIYDVNFKLEVITLEDCVNKWSEYCLSMMLENVYNIPESKTGVQEEGIYFINTDTYPLPEEGNDIFESRDKFSSIVRGPESPLVSILVIAYNRIDKTKQCIESILKYTEGINYELVLVDNGSDKDILAYYQSVDYKNKKIIRITKNMQLSFGTLKGTEYCSGKYIALLGNDIVVTSNWLNNILRCFESDMKIGMVCAMSSNISNLQQADLQFKSMQDMQDKAAKFNISDPRKWHERLRLITAGAVYKAECIHIAGNWDYGFFHDFSDDDLTFHIRRAGYKTVLCKDVFVHHDHIIGTEKKQGEFEKSLAKGRENFKKKYFGIDAWDDVNNFELTMMSMLKKNHNKKNINILGIDVRCGTPILEIKNNLKAFGLWDSELFAFYKDAKYTIDLSTICEGSVICDRIEFISEYFFNKKFEYILVGEPLNSYNNPEKILRDIVGNMSQGGQLLIKVYNNHNVLTFLNMANSKNEYPEKRYNLLRPETLQKLVEDLGCKIDEMKPEHYNLDDASKRNLVNAIKNSGLSQNSEKSLNELLINNYIFSITK